MKQQIDEFIKMAGQVHEICMDGYVMLKENIKFDFDANFSLHYYRGDNNKHYIVTFRDKWVNMIEYNSIIKSITVPISADANNLWIYNDALRKNLADGRIESEVAKQFPYKKTMLEIRAFEQKIEELKQTLKQTI